MCYGLYVRMEQLYSHCKKNVHEILYHRRVTKSVHQIQVRIIKPTAADTLHGDRCALIFISRHLRDSYLTKKYGTTRQAEDTTDDLHRTQLLGRSKGEKSEHEEEILKLLCLEVVETG